MKVVKELDEYQKYALETAVYPDRKTFSGKMYCALGLNGEAGEVAEVIKKIYRDDGGKVDYDKWLKLKKELGDVLWYVAVLADEMGMTLREVAEMNVYKLDSRKQRGVLSGSGDDR